MRIVTGAQMRQIEETAFANGVEQQDLMRRAGQAVAGQALARRATCTQPCRALVGPRNNGGDGLVVAEALRAASLHTVTLWFYQRADTTGAPVAADLLEQATSIRAGASGAEEALRASVAEADLIVDAVYGIGGRQPYCRPIPPPRWRSSTSARLIPARHTHRARHPDWRQRR